jgi:hypothetical protein
MDRFHGGTSRPASALEWAESNACAWLVYQGFFDAAVVADPDTAGVSIRGAEVVAQVKFTPNPVTLDEVKELNAVMIATKRQGFYFSVSGFTDEAAEWGDLAGVVLLRMILDGAPANETARKWLRRPERVTPTKPVERLKEGDRIADSNGGYRVVSAVHTRKAGKGLLMFHVEFEDGGEIEHEIGKNVVLYEPIAP